MQTAQFTTTPLINGGVLVEGTDVNGKTGTTILLSDKWDMVQEYKRSTVAKEAFDAEVEEFFKPLTDAAEQAQALIEGPKPANLSTVVLSEAVEGQPAFEVELDTDGMILRLLAEGGWAQLRWVSDDLLVAVVA